MHVSALPIEIFTEMFYTTTLKINNDLWQSKN